MGSISCSAHSREYPPASPENCKLTSEYPFELRSYLEMAQKGLQHIHCYGLLVLILCNIPAYLFIQAAPPVGS